MSWRWIAAVILSVVTALVLTSIPLPSWADGWRPAWVALVIFYWSLAIPERFGVLSAWTIGMFADVMHGAILGQHALGFAFVAYVALLYHQRIRVFPMVQQALVVGSLIFLYLVWMLVCYNFLGSRPYPISFLLGAVSSAAIWPWLYVVLRDVRRLTT